MLHRVRSWARAGGAPRSWRPESRRMRSAQLRSGRWRRTSRRGDELQFYGEDSVAIDCDRHLARVGAAKGSHYSGQLGRRAPSLAPRPQRGPSWTAALADKLMKEDVSSRSRAVAWHALLERPKRRAVTETSPCAAAAMRK
eukprot:13578097-Heterocapsa_arctica.AAC.1